MSFAHVTDLFQNPEMLLKAANAVNGAYAISQNQQPTPFGLGQKESFGSSVAAVFAADAAAQYIAVRQNAGDAPPSYANYMAGLKYLAQGGLDKELDCVKYIVRLMANLAWRSCQAFRGSDYERLKRPVNQAFATLDGVELAKDDGQIMAAAQALFDHLDSAKTETAAEAA